MTSKLLPSLRDAEEREKHLRDCLQQTVHSPLSPLPPLRQLDSLFSSSSYSENSKEAKVNTGSSGRISITDSSSSFSPDVVMSTLQSEFCQTQLSANKTCNALLEDKYIANKHSNEVAVVHWKNGVPAGERAPGDQASVSCVHDGSLSAASLPSAKVMDNESWTSSSRSSSLSSSSFSSRDFCFPHSRSCSSSPACCCCCSGGCSLRGFGWEWMSSFLRCVETLWKCGGHEEPHPSSSSSASYRFSLSSSSRRHHPASHWGSCHEEENGENNNHRRTGKDKENGSEDDSESSAVVGEESALLEHIPVEKVGKRKGCGKGSARSTSSSWPFYSSSTAEGGKKNITPEYAKGVKNGNTGMNRCSTKEKRKYGKGKQWNPMEKGVWPRSGAPFEFSPSFSTPYSFPSSSSSLPFGGATGVPYSSQLPTSSSGKIHDVELNIGGEGSSSTNAPPPGSSSSLFSSLPSSPVTPYISSFSDPNMNLPFSEGEWKGENKAKNQTNKKDGEEERGEGGGPNRPQSPSAVGGAADVRGRPLSPLSLFRCTDAVSGMKIEPFFLESSMCAPHVSTLQHGDTSRITLQEIQSTSHVSLSVQDLSVTKNGSLKAVDDGGGYLLRGRSPHTPLSIHTTTALCWPPLSMQITPEALYADAMHIRRHGYPLDRNGAEDPRSSTRNPFSSPSSHTLYATTTISSSSTVPFEEREAPYSTIPGTTCSKQRDGQEPVEWMTSSAHLQTFFDRYASFLPFELHVCSDPSEAFILRDATSCKGYFSPFDAAREKETSREDWCSVTRTGGENDGGYGGGVVGGRDLSFSKATSFSVGHATGTVHGCNYSSAVKKSLIQATAAGGGGGGGMWEKGMKDTSPSTSGVQCIQLCLRGPIKTTTPYSSLLSIMEDVLLEDCDSRFAITSLKFMDMNIRLAGASKEGWDTAGCGGMGSRPLPHCQTSSFFYDFRRAGMRGGGEEKADKRKSMIHQGVLLDCLLADSPSISPDSYPCRGEDQMGHGKQHISHNRKGEEEFLQKDEKGKNYEGRMEGVRPVPSRGMDVLNVSRPLLDFHPFGMMGGVFPFPDPRETKNCNTVNGNQNILKSAGGKGGVDTESEVQSRIRIFINNLLDSYRDRPGDVPPHGVRLNSLILCRIVCSPLDLPLLCGVVSCDEEDNVTSLYQEGEHAVASSGLSRQPDTSSSLPSSPALPRSPPLSINRLIMEQCPFTSVHINALLSAVRCQRSHLSSDVSSSLFPMFCFFGKMHELQLSGPLTQDCIENVLRVIEEEEMLMTTALGSAAVAAPAPTVTTISSTQAKASMENISTIPLSMMPDHSVLRNEQEEREKRLVAHENTHSDARIPFFSLKIIRLPHALLSAARKDRFLADHPNISVQAL